MRTGFEVVMTPENNIEEWRLQESSETYQDQVSEADKNIFSKSSLRQLSKNAVEKAYIAIESVATVFT